VVAIGCRLNGRYVTLIGASTMARAGQFAPYSGRWERSLTSRGAKTTAAVAQSEAIAARGDSMLEIGAGFDRYGY